MTYDKFIETIKRQATMMIVNYEIDDQELDTLIEIVYNDISSHVSLMQFNQVVELDDSIKTYDLNELLYLETGNNTQMLGAYAIFTKCGIDVSKCWEETCKDTYCMVENADCGFSAYPTTEEPDLTHPGMTIKKKYVVFKRHVIPDLKLLSPSLQQAIQNAMVQGIIERATEMIPSPTGSQAPMQEEGYRQSRYENEKTKLVNKFAEYV